MRSDINLLDNSKQTMTPSEEERIAKCCVFILILIPGAIVLTIISNGLATVDGPVPACQHFWVSRCIKMSASECLLQCEGENFELYKHRTKQSSHIFNIIVWLLSTIMDSLNEDEESEKDTHLANGATFITSEFLDSVLLTEDVLIHRCRIQCL